MATIETMFYGKTTTTEAIFDGKMITNNKTIKHGIEMLKGENCSM